MLRLVLGQRIDVRVATERHGSAYGGWTICPARIDAGSVVYSFGIGDDVSFDLSVIRRYGVEVHAFDPTPEAVEWVRAQRLPAKFRFHEYGIADYDGTAVFYPPLRADHVSWSMCEKRRRSGYGPRALSIVAPVRRLSSIMNELGHGQVDLLKMDIEGAEYAVIRDVLGAGVAVHQWVVEFHHSFAGAGWRRTRDAIRLLRRHSFRIFAVSDTGREVSLIRV